MLRIQMASICPTPFRLLAEFNVKVLEVSMNFREVKLLSVLTFLLEMLIMV